jgi:protein-tyrosine phosphatase
VTESRPFVDIHCHLVPHVDDGPGSWEESLKMARMAADDGIGTIVATPHQLGNFGRNQPDMIRAGVAHLRQLLREHNVPLTVLPGADVRVEEALVPNLKKGTVLTLADRRKHVLLELPHELYFPLTSVLADLRAIRITAILSHPERNHGLQSDRHVIGQMVAAGCLMQVTAGSLVGTFGTDSQRTAEWMLRRGLVHFVATDAHGAEARRPLLHRAYQRVVRLLGQPAAEELFCRNPSRVANGRDFVPSPRSPNRSRWWNWLVLGEGRLAIGS